ncbi:hypothetical protein HDK64DRAFT_104312 [Phyllosticta capitalensis]
MLTSTRLGSCLFFVEFLFFFFSGASAPFELRVLRIFDRPFRVKPFGDGTSSFPFFFASSLYFSLRASSVAHGQRLFHFLVCVDSVTHFCPFLGTAQVVERPSATHESSLLLSFFPFPARPSLMVKRG